MKTIVTAIAAAATLGLAVLTSAAPAQAIDYGRKFQLSDSRGGGYGSFHGGYGHNFHRSHYHSGGYGSFHGGYGHNYGYRHVERCFWNKKRYWNGYGWEWKSERICR
jgi:hypothetical protein